MNLYLAVGRNNKKETTCLHVPVSKRSDFSTSTNLRHNTTSISIETVLNVSTVDKEDFRIQNSSVNVVYTINYQF